MAKKQSTIYLNEDVHSYLMEYKSNNRLNNLSVAIERIILERIFNEQGNLNYKPIEKIKEKKKDIPKTILDLKSSMRD
jgi:hypothetical protein